MKILKSPLWLVKRIVRQRSSLRTLQQEYARLATQVQELQATITRLHEERSCILDENQQLQQRVKDLAQRCSETNSQLAAFNHRVVELSQDNERLEMNITGTRAQRDTLQTLVQRFRDEIQHLKDELATCQSRQKQGP